MPPTLLLADDSATIQRVIELTFAGEDIQVISVSDGDQAIARLQSSPPDIVLADVGMPGKTGYEVADFVKRTPSLAHIPVVLLTGAFEPVDQAKAAAVGCSGVLAKPFEPQIVISRVRELLGRSASADGSSPAAAQQAPPDPFGFAPAPASAPAPVAEIAVEPASESKVEDYFDRLDAAFATLSNPSSVPAAPVASAPVTAAPPPVVDELDWLRPKTDAPQAPELQDFAMAEEPAAPDPFATFKAAVVEAAPAVEEPAVILEAEPAEEGAPVQEPEAAFELEPEIEPEPELPAPPPAFAPIRLAKFEPEPAAAPIPVAKFEPLEEPDEPRTPSREPRLLPSIADAFATILAAEQNSLGVRPEWPAPTSSPGAAAAVSGAPAGSTELVITDDLVDRVARRVLEQLSDRIVRETVAQLASDAAERLVKEEIDRIKASIK